MKKAKAVRLARRGSIMLMMCGALAMSAFGAQPVNAPEKSAGVRHAGLSDLEAALNSGLPSAQSKRMLARDTDRGLAFTLGAEVFDANEWSLVADGARQVKRLAIYLKQNPRRNILIEGFGDNAGAESVNLELSEQRIRIVRSVLLDQGVNLERISSFGYGASHPVAGNDTAAGRRKNRRVEITISEDDGEIDPR